MSEYKPGVGGSYVVGGDGVKLRERTADRRDPSYDPKAKRPDGKTDEQALAEEFTAAETKASKKKPTVKTET